MTNIVVPTTRAEFDAEWKEIRARESLAQQIARRDSKLLFGAIASRVRNLRIELGLSAADMARRLSCTVETYMDTEDAVSERMSDALEALNALEAIANARASERAS